MFNFAIASWAEFCNYGWFAVRFADGLSLGLRTFVGGALPLLPTDCPYRARYHLNPGHWGEPRVSQSFGLLYPGLRYHCPYRAPWVQNLRRSALLCEVRLHLSIAHASKLASLCIRFALTLPLQGAMGSKPPMFGMLGRAPRFGTWGCVWILKNRIGMTNDTEG